jgi:hypothetical protein
VLKLSQKENSALGFILVIGNADLPSLLAHNEDLAFWKFRQTCFFRISRSKLNRSG